MSFDPVEIVIRLVQDIDKEGDKASKGIDKMAEASERTRKRLEKDIAAQKAVVDKLTASVEKLQAQMAKRVDANNPKQTAETEKLTQKIDEQNKELEEQIKLHEQLRQQRTKPMANMADTQAYAKGMQNLSFSMQQVARELPVLAISPQTFIMAISNNLPMLQDQIRKTQAMNKELKASGQATVPVWKQLGKSLLSPQTAMIALITIGTLYGSEIIEWTKKTLKFGNSAELSGKKLKDLTKAISESLGSEMGKVDALFYQLNRATKCTEEYAAVKSKIIDQYGDYLKGADSEISSLEDVAAAYELITKAIRQKVEAQVIEQKIVDLRTKLDDDIIDDLLAVDKRFQKMFGEKEGAEKFIKLRIALEGGKELDDEMKALVKQFGYDDTITSEGMVRTVKGNYIKKNVENISKAFKEYNKEIAKTQRIVGTLFDGNENEDVKSLITDAERALDLAKLMPTSTEVEITERNKAIEAAEKEIDRLNELGKSKEDANSKATKSAKSKKDLADMELDAELALQRGIIAAMEDGIVKQKALAKQAYDDRLRELKDKEQKYVDTLNEINGEKEGDKGYITSLPDYVQANPNDTTASSFLGNQGELSTQAYEAYTAKISEINKTASDNRTKLMDGIQQRFMSELEKRKTAVKTFYDEQEQKARANGSTDAELAEIATARATELAKIETQTASKLADVYSEAFGDIANYGTRALQRLSAEIDAIVASAKTVKIGDKEMVSVSIPTDQLDEDNRVITELVNVTLEDFNRLQKRSVAISQQMATNNPFIGLKDAWDKYRLAKENGDDAVANQALNTALSSTDAIANQLSGLADQLDDVFGEAVGNIARLGADLMKSGTQLAKGIMSGNPLDMLGGALGVFQTLTRGSKEYHEKQRQYLEELTQLQLGYNAALLQQIRLQDESSVFVTDYEQTVANAAKARAEAQKQLNETYSEQALGELSIKTGTDRDKFLGITISSWDTYGDLSENFDKVTGGHDFSDLTDDAGNLNTELANVVLQSEKLDSESQALLEKWIVLQDEIDASNEAIANAVKSLAGDLGNSLASSLQDAWSAGEDGFAGFKDTVSSGLQDVISEMVFNEVAADALQTLQDDLSTALQSGDENAIAEAYANLAKQGDEIVNQYNDAMQEAMDAAEREGLDMSGTKERTATTKGIAQASQDSVDELNGRMTAIQMYVDEIRKYNAKMVEDSSSQVDFRARLLTAVQAIQDNTSFNKHLKTIDSSLKEIQTKGLKVK